MIITIISLLFVCLGLYILYEFLKQNNILFSDFKVGTKKYKTKNIFNHTIECFETYYIYKSWCFGLIRLPLKLSITDGWKIAHHIYVYYDTCSYSTFNNKKECKHIINDIKEKQNKYILF